MPAVAPVMSLGVIGLLLSFGRMSPVSLFSILVPLFLASSHP